MDKKNQTGSQIDAGILDNALVMIVVLGEKGQVVSWNHAAETITGYTRDEVIGKNTVWKDLYPDPRYRKTITTKILDILKAKNSFQNLETTIRTRSGESRVILWNTRTIVAEGREQSIAVGMDITETREASMFRDSIIDNAHVLIAVLGPKGRILVWNKAAEMITGYTAGEVIGGNEIWKKIYPDPNYRRTITQKITRIIAENDFFENLETTIITKSGEQRHISWNTRQIGYGGKYHDIAIGRDITEQREAAMFRESIIDNAYVFITVSDRKGTIRIWNKAAEAISGYTAGEVVGNRDIWEKVYPDPEYRKEVIRKISRMVAENNYTDTMETTIRTQSGDRRVMSWNTRQIELGGVPHQIRIGLDITNMREAAMFRDSIIDNANVLITVLGPNGTILVWNKAAEMMTGYTPDEVIGRTDIWKKLYPDPGYRRTVTQKISQIITEHNFFENLETRITTKSGEQRDISWNTRQIGADGTYLSIAIGRDITDLREAMMFRESVIDNAYVLITVLGPKGTVLVWNKAAEMITGYDRDEVIGFRDIWKKIYPDPEYRREVTRKISQIISEHNFFENLETTILTKTGEERYISWNTRQIGFSGIHHEIAIGRDITEQRKAEDALVAYMTEMSMRLKRPVGIVSETLIESAQLIKDGLLSSDEIIMILEGQARNATQIEANIQEFQTAIVSKNREIPEAYRKFLEG